MGRPNKHTYIITKLHQSSHEIILFLTLLLYQRKLVVFKFLTISSTQVCLFSNFNMFLACQIHQHPTFIISIKSFLRIPAKTHQVARFQELFHRRRNEPNNFTLNRDLIPDASSNNAETKNMSGSFLTRTAQGTSIIIDLNVPSLQSIRSMDTIHLSSPYQNIVFSWNLFVPFHNIYVTVHRIPIFHHPSNDSNRKLFLRPAKPLPPIALSTDPHRIQISQ
ncbi:hypothetical protein HanIR_Chr06g0288051 [Helianthus annuus]|nr:hypothetical protein HanIR_Chr06g0288051 [Helianthus annuus]